jgi:hypothetical protein
MTTQIVRTVFTFAVLVVLSIVCSVATIKARTSPTCSSFQDGDVYSIKEAGVQFTIPKTWKVEKKDNGNVMVLFEDGAGSITFVIEDNYTEVVSGMKAALKDKLTDLKLEGDSKQDTHNGMTHISERGTGMMEGVKIILSIDVLKATKNLTILTFAIDRVLQAHMTEYDKFVDSIKKI